MATGHYARRRWDEATGRWQLLRASDPAKDQSYVLYHLTQDTLAHMLFPLGELTKDEVREMARARGFVTAEKPESQDICFVPDGDYAGFIEGHCGAGAAFEPGEIVNRGGRVLGEHAGLIRYTIGQRKGIGVAAREPLYVLGKDASANRLVVGFKDELLSVRSGGLRCESHQRRRFGRPAQGAGEDPLPPAARCRLSPSRPAPTS